MLFDQTPIPLRFGEQQPATGRVADFPLRFDLAGSAALRKKDVRTGDERLPGLAQAAAASRSSQHQNQGISPRATGRRSSATRAHSVAAPFAGRTGRCPARARSARDGANQTNHAHSKHSRMDAGSDAWMIEIEAAGRDDVQPGLLGPQRPEAPITLAPQAGKVPAVAAPAVDVKGQESPRTRVGLRGAGLEQAAGQRLVFAVVDGRVAAAAAEEVAAIGPAAVKQPARLVLPEAAVRLRVQDQRGARPVGLPQRRRRGRQRPGQVKIVVVPDGQGFDVVADQGRGRVAFFAQGGKRCGTDTSRQPGPAWLLYWPASSRMTSCRRCGG